MRTGSAPARAGFEATPRVNAEVVSALAVRFAAQLRQYWPKELATAAWALATVLHGLPVLDSLLRNLGQECQCVGRKGLGESTQNTHIMRGREIAQSSSTAQPRHFGPKELGPAAWAQGALWRLHTLGCLSMTGSVLTAFLTNNRLFAPVSSTCEILSLTNAVLCCTGRHAARAPLTPRACYCADGGVGNTTLP